MQQVHVLQLVDRNFVCADFTEQVRSVCGSGVNSSWGYSSVVEHSTADREVPGSNPGAPSPFYFFPTSKMLLPTDT